VAGARPAPCRRSRPWCRPMARASTTPFAAARSLTPAPRPDRADHRTACPPRVRPRAYGAIRELRRSACASSTRRWRSFPSTYRSTACLLPMEGDLQAAHRFWHLSARHRRHAAHAGQGTGPDAPAAAKWRCSACRFLDCICCGFGAIILLLVLRRDRPARGAGAEAASTWGAKCGCSRSSFMSFAGRTDELNRELAGQPARLWRRAARGRRLTNLAGGPQSHPGPLCRQPRGRLGHQHHRAPAGQRPADAQRRDAAARHAARTEPEERCHRRHSDRQQLRHFSSSTPPPA